MGKEGSKPISGNKLQHERLGGQQKTNSIKLKRQIQSHAKYLEWQKQLSALLSDDFRQVFYLPQTYSFTPQSICGTAGVIEVFVYLYKMQFQYYKFVLKTQITSRHHSRMPFDQVQLWYLLYNLLEAAYLLEPLNRKIGDVHPSNILVNQKGRIKVIATCVFPRTLNNYQKIVQEKISDAFIAPEEIDQILIDKGIYPKVNLCKAEMYSIGLTILMAATLTDCYFLYDRGKLKINEVKLAELLDQVKKLYSPYFYTTLLKLLQANPKERKGAGELFRELNRFQDQILSLKKFENHQAPRNQISHTNLQSHEPSIADFLPQRGSQFNSPKRETLAKFNSR